MTSSVLAGLLARQPFRPFAFVFAADREVSVIEYLEAMINPLVQQDLEDVLKKLTRRRPKGDE